MNDKAGKHGRIALGEEEMEVEVEEEWSGGKGGNRRKVGSAGRGVDRGRREGKERS